ncbi:MAG: DUF4349 domain-containing protein [Gaiellaceae bacterium]
MRSLPAPQPRVAWSFPVRQALVVAAPALVVLALGAAALHGVLSGGTPAPVAEKAIQHGSGAGTAPQDSSAFRAATTPSLTPGTVLHGAIASPLAPSATRLNKYEAWLRVQVPHDDLSADATRAMQIARGYGGYVAAVDMNTPGKSGVASLVLRIPNDKVQEAVLRLGQLGTVTAQHVRIADLQRAADAQQRTILQLRIRIATLEQSLASASATERPPLELQLAEAKQQLANTTKAHATTVREGTLATVSVTLFVPQPAAAAPHRQGRLGRTAHEAGTFLVRELAWLLFALIVFAPIALLAFGAVVALRALRRRGIDRLLDAN